MEDVTKSKCYNRLKLGIKISFVTNVVLVVTLLCVYIGHRVIDSNRPLHDNIQTVHQQAIEDTLPHTICLVCSHLEFVTGMEENDVYDVVSSPNGNRLCCIKDGFEIQNIFLKMLRRNHYVSHRNSTLELKEMTQGIQWWRERDFSAHLYGDFYDIKNGAQTWTIDNSFGTGFIRNLTLLPDRSKVRLTSLSRGNGEGIYFIYSLITLTLNSSTKQNLGIHRINRSNREVWNGTPNPLTITYFGGDSTKTGSVVSFLCTTERLKIGDTIDISVNVINESSYKSSGKFSNYFGIFKL